MSGETRIRLGSRHAPAVASWDAFYASTERRAAPQPQVVALARGLAPGSRVLDLGCGNGVSAVPLAQLGHRVDALDFSPRALQQCRELAAAHGVGSRVHTIQADMATYDYPRARYDLIIAVGSLNHVTASRRLEPIARVIKRLKAAVRPGGRHYLLIMTDMRTLALRRGQTANTMTSSQLRATWARAGGASKPVSALGRAAALRVVMSQYGDPAWEVESLDFPTEGQAHLFPYGSGQVRRAYYVELTARRI